MALLTAPEVIAIDQVTEKENKRQEKNNYNAYRIQIVYKHHLPAPLTELRCG